jgi:hypothetical protein
MVRATVATQGGTSVRTLKSENREKTTEHVGGETGEARAA